MKAILILVMLFVAASAPTFSQTNRRQPARNNQTQRQAAAARATIDALRSQFVEAWNRQDADAVAQFYTEDATYIGTAGDVVQSRDRIRLGLRGELPVFRNFTATPAEFGSSGDLAYERGVYSARLEIPNRTPEAVRGKYLIVYRRQADSTWKIQMHMSGRDRAQR